MTATPTLDAILDFIAAALTRRFPANVVDAAKQCLVDWFGVALGALDDPTARSMAALAVAWRTRGDSWMLTGGNAAPPVAALVNGTLAHALDFDDTHLGSVLHTSGPSWAAVLALGAERKLGGDALLRAFIAGFEVATQLGGNGLGLRISRQGWHATGVLGRIAAATAGAVLLGLDRAATANALGLAATQASGLVVSFGTMAKPFHAGKAAIDGLIAAELAASGFTASHEIFDSVEGLFPSLLQDAEACHDVAMLGRDWQILRNAFKPYAACQLTHASIDAARELAPRLLGSEIASVRAFVSAMAAQIAGKTRPSSPTEGKFSLAYCIALGLTGRVAAASDFAPERIADPALQALAARVEIAPKEGIERWGARLETRLGDGRIEAAETTAALGSPENPMRWPALEAKFLALAEPVLGSRSRKLLDLLRGFEALRSLDPLAALLGVSSARSTADE